MNTVMVDEHRNGSGQGSRVRNLGVWMVAAGLAAGWLIAGPARAAEICTRARIDPAVRASELTESDIGTIAKILQDQFTVEGDLRRQVAQNIRRLIAIGSYRGQRHRRGLPVRGQRTKTNARTRKGAKKTVGAIRDRSERKQASADKQAWRNPEPTWPTSRPCPAAASTAN